jgi:hypothetical protein
LGSARLRFDSTAPHGKVRNASRVVWGVAVGVYFLAVVHRSSLGVAGPQAVDRMDFSAGQPTTFLVLQLSVYAAMQLPTGIPVDRLGPAGCC